MLGWTGAVGHSTGSARMRSKSPSAFSLASASLKRKRVVVWPVDERRDGLGAEGVPPLPDEELQTPSDAADRASQPLVTHGLAVGGADDLVEQTLVRLLGLLLTDLAAGLTGLAPGGYESPTRLPRLRD